MQNHYQVIARRYRPRSFEEVVGQGAAASTLRNAILQDRLAHAYLFCGPRGVGKTSMARIFARALNCPEASSPERPEEERGKPCGKCEVCLAVHDGDDIDVIEMDGASNRGIEDVREIIEGVKFAPTRTPYKIYIVDEVHMLTREAFNAFLKVLEEPPAHVKFIFATTEPHKIPDTVLSRCQRFDFHPIGNSAIVERLRQICEAESVQAGDEVLERLARYSKGGLRDSQTLLDQLISFSSGEITLEDLDRITGRLDERRLEELLGACLKNDPARALELLSSSFSEGTDPSILLEQLVEILRQQLLETLATPGEDGETDPGLVDRLAGSLQILHETALRLKGSPFPQLAVELAVTRLARLEKLRTLEETIDWLRRFEALAREGTPVPVARVPAPAPPAPAAASTPERFEAPPPAGAPASPEPPSVDRPSPANPDLPVEPAPVPPAAEPPPPEMPAATGNGHPSPAPRPSPEPPAAVASQEEAPADAPGAAPDFQQLESVWGQVMLEFRQQAPHLHACLAGSRREERGPGQLQIRLSSEFHMRQLEPRASLQRLEGLIREVSGASWKVSVLHDPDLQMSPAGGAPETSGPALREHPLVKKTQEIFRGRLC